MSSTSGWDDAVDELYALAPGDFVAARNALAKQMRADGQRGEAAAVAKLKKPSVVAWALNQAVRADPDRVAALIEAAERQAVAQQDLFVGGAAGALRAATADRRDAARAVVEAAVAVAGPNHADAVRTTLDAAMADPELAERLRSGTLADTLDAPAGFGFGFGVGEDDEVDEVDDTPALRRARPGDRPAKEARATSAGASDEDRSGVDAHAAAAAEAARSEARAAVAELERDLARAEKWATKAGSSVDAAEQEVLSAEEALDAARQRLDDARDERERATAELAARRGDHDHQRALLDQARALLEELEG